MINKVAIVDIKGCGHQNFKIVSDCWMSHYSSNILHPLGNSLHFLEHFCLFSHKNVSKNWVLVLAEESWHTVGISAYPKSLGGVRGFEVRALHRSCTVFHTSHGKLFLLDIALCKRSLTCWEFPQVVHVESGSHIKQYYFLLFTFFFFFYRNYSYIFMEHWWHIYIFFY